jgi:uncharacterized membrane protein (DUF4010 family)
VTPAFTDVAGILVAALGGAAVGIERQRSGHAVGPEARLGGVRTFTMLGGAAGLAGYAMTSGFAGLGTVLAAAALALIVAAYVAASRRDVDATTEVAGLVVVAAGAASGTGQLGLAAGIIAITVLLLAEKTRLHGWVARLDEPTLLAAARFGVMSVVVLPLLPPGPYGPPPGVRPRELWLLVLLFSGLSFAGFLGRRIAGRAAYPLAGLLGGLVSSTSVTLAFARLSRLDPRQGDALAAGAVAASTVLFLRVSLALAILNRSLLADIGRTLSLPFVIGVVAAAVISGRTQAGAEDESHLMNPLQLRAALEMAALFQIVLFGVHFARQWLGNVGVLWTGFVLGLTDVDALTISMARSAATGTPSDIAARAILLGILANTLLKSAIALVVGEGRFVPRTVVPLVVMSVALAAVVFL